MDKKIVRGFFSGVTGLSLTSLGAYTMALNPSGTGTEWELVHYFQSTFGFAGIILGVLLSIGGIVVFLEGLLEDIEGDEE